MQGRDEFFMPFYTSPSVLKHDEKEMGRREGVRGIYTRTHPFISYVFYEASPDALLMIVMIKTEMLI